MTMIKDIGDEAYVCINKPVCTVESPVNASLRFIVNSFIFFCRPTQIGLTKMTSVIIRAALCDNATREPLYFAAVCFFSFFLFLFSARSPRSLGRSPRNLSQKIWGRKTCFFRRDFGRLRTSVANISGTEQDSNNR